jgi:hypothetical protein
MLISCRIHGIGVLQVVLAWALAFVLTSVNGDARRQWREQGPPGSRPHSVTITEFGAVGDGRTLNTLPFQNAVFYARSFADKGGAQLYVPKGRWLTGSFNLTSHLTLFLEEEATIIGSKVTSSCLFSWNCYGGSYRFCFHIDFRRGVCSLVA